MRRTSWIIALTCSIGIGCSEYKLEGSTEDGEADTAVDRDEDPDREEDDDPPPEDTADPESPGPDDTGVGDTYQITGRVCNPAGESEEGWVAGAFVYTGVDDDGDGVEDRQAEDRTDEEGRFVLDGLPSGEYTVYVEKGSFSVSYDVLLDGASYDIPEEDCALEPPTIAVVTGEYDQIEAILDDLELEYTLIGGTVGTSTPAFVDFLRDPVAMARFDMIFFNCGISDYDWMAYESEIATNVRSYVDAGGSVYASDWAYYLVEKAFSSKIDFYGDDNYYSTAQVGADGPITATVVDPVMMALLGGSTADIMYDLPMWVVPERIESGVEVLLRARVTVDDFWTGYTGTVSDAPIAVRFVFGTGRVIYTSFHNEEQTGGTTLDMQKILEEIVLSL